MVNCYGLRFVNVLCHSYLHEQSLVRLSHSVYSGMQGNPSASHAAEVHFEMGVTRSLNNKNVVGQCLVLLCEDNKQVMHVRLIYTASCPDCQ